MDHQIRDYTISDHDALLAFMAAAFADIGSTLDLADKDPDLADVTGVYHRDGGRFLVAVHDGRIVGTVALRRLDGTACELKRFYVDARHRGRGIGTALLKRAIAHARHGAFEAIRLDTTRRSDAAIRLFERYGFTPTERYNDDPFAELFMELNLDNDQTPYITPAHVMHNRFKDGCRPAWSTAILCFRDCQGSSTIVRELNAEPLGYKVIYSMDETPDLPLAHEATIGDERVGVIACCNWGGPQAAIIVEELAHLGVRTIVGLGMAGSIDAALPKHALVLAAPALVTDGTSCAYTDQPAVQPDASLLARARTAADALDLPFVEAAAATVDALYRETPAAVARWRRQGARMLNMESAPLYAAAQTCGVRALWIGHVSDCLVGDTWDAWDGPLEQVAPKTVRLAERVLSDVARKEAG